MRAAPLYEKATKDRPDELEAYSRAATLYEILHDWSKAQELWSRAAENSPSPQAVLNNERRAALLGLLESDDTDSGGKAEIWREIGTLYTKNGAFEKAIHAYSQSVEEEPRNLTTLLLLSECLLETGRFPEAAETLEIALARASDADMLSRVQAQLESIRTIVARSPSAALSVAE